MAPRTEPQTPWRKKQLAYKKDHVLAVEHKDGFNRRWRRKKAHAARAYRRRVNQLLEPASALAQPEAREPRPAETVRRRVVRKWRGTAMPLAQWVRRRQEMRLKRTAWNFFKRPYSSAGHREPFVRFLASITDSRSARVHPLAEHLHDLLYNPSPPRLGWLDYRPRRIWLSHFFNDEPAWRTLLDAWFHQFGLPPESNQQG